MCQMREEAQLSSLPFVELGVSPLPPQGPSSVNLCLSPISNSAKLPLVPPLQAPDLACGAAGTPFRGCLPPRDLERVCVAESPSCFSSQVKLTTFLPCRLLQYLPLEPPV
ncbi:centrosomal protein of 112 kDa-like protein [Platysternon megacephalum]|uniref:Centrosomal protein of 112 kDa-like protein n=1 Tax=Platysternon megacephalum TaxID=55544 RepID=A0A4D9E220_9SAUR|nr:centrosomal protein of 112 kDa-like protein [Platysternon megacephalum]